MITEELLEHMRGQTVVDQTVRDLIGNTVVPLVQQYVTNVSFASHTHTHTHTHTQLLGNSMITITRASLVRSLRMPPTSPHTRIRRCIAHGNDVYDD